MVCVGYKKHLAVIILISLLLRLGPVALWGMPISYDTPFHQRHAEFAWANGFLPALDPATGAVNSYPPLYHLLLAVLGLIGGIDVSLLAMLLLPLAAAMVPLTVFLFVRRAGGERNAVIAALLTAVASPLIAASFDSPENFAFLLLPVVLLLAQKRRCTAAGLLYSSLLLWNYFVVLASAIPFLIAYRRRRRMLGSAILGAVLVVMFHCSTKGFWFLGSGTLDTGMRFVANNLQGAMPAIAALTLIAALPIIYFAFLGRVQRGAHAAVAQWKAGAADRANQNFLLCWSVLSLLALLSFWLGPVLRPWEHVKFAALAGIILLMSLQTGAGLAGDSTAESRAQGAAKAQSMQTWRVRSERLRSVFAVFLAALMLCTALPLSFQTIFPRVTAMDAHAVWFLEQRHEQRAGKILAAPGVSEHLRIATGLDDALITSLFFEESGETALGEALTVLMHEHNAPGEFLADEGVRYIITNFEDAQLRGTREFADVPWLDKRYELAYYQGCAFAFIPKQAAYACGRNKTEVFEFGHE